jgi:CBS domain-containing protein
MKIMTEKHFRHLPVLQDNILCGIILIGDIVNQIIKSQKTTIEDMQNYISGSGYGY